jgi:hypothetical protein
VSGEGGAYDGNEVHQLATLVLPRDTEHLPVHTHLLRSCIVDADNSLGWRAIDQMTAKPYKATLWECSAVEQEWTTSDTAMDWYFHSLQS